MKTKHNRQAGDIEFKRDPRAGARNTMEVKFRPASDDELKEAQITELPDGFIAGWASTSDLDHAYDVVLPGAFDKAIQAKGLNGPKGIKLLIQHDASKPAGIIHKLEQRGGGLWIEAQLALDVTYVKDFYTVTKMIGGLNFSIGYELKEGGFRFVEKPDGEQSYWELSEIGLFEVSCVTFPCNESAEMLVVKDREYITETTAEFEKSLVESGIVSSRNDAQRVTRRVKQCKAFETKAVTPPAAVTDNLDFKDLNEVNAFFAKFLDN